MAAAAATPANTDKPNSGNIILDWTTPQTHKHAPCHRSSVARQSVKGPDHSRCRPGKYLVWKVGFFKKTGFGFWNQIIILESRKHVQQFTHSASVSVHEGNEATLRNEMKQKKSSVHTKKVGFAYTSVGFVFQPFWTTKDERCNCFHELNSLKGFCL